MSKIAQPSSKELNCFDQCCPKTVPYSGILKPIGEPESQSNLTNMSNDALMSKPFVGFRIHPVNKYELFRNISAYEENGERLFRSDCREVYVISNSYGMWDLLASRFGKVGITVKVEASHVSNCLKPGTRPEGWGLSHPKVAKK